MQFTDKQQHLVTPSRLQWPWWKIAMIWLLVTLLFSTPTAMYALSKTLPGNENSIGLSINVLQGFQYSAGLLLHFINAVLVPLAARALTKKSNPHQATALILFARFMVTRPTILFYSLFFSFSDVE